VVTNTLLSHGLHVLQPKSQTCIPTPLSFPTIPSDPEVLMRRSRDRCPCSHAIGRFLGALKDVPVRRFARRSSRLVLGRSKLDPTRVDDVVFAQSYANSETPCVGRWAGLVANLPIEVPGCNSTGAAEVASGGDHCSHDGADWALPMRCWPAALRA